MAETDPNDEELSRLLGELVEPHTKVNGPPKRDPWDEYAIDKVQSVLIGEEFYFEDAANTAAFWAFMLVLCIGGLVVHSIVTNDTLTAWTAIAIGGCLLGTLASIVVWVWGRILLRRVRRHQKQIDRHGLKRL